MWLLAILASAALIADLVVHLAATLGFNPQDWIQPPWLAISLFWAPAVVLALFLVAREQYRKRKSRRGGLPPDPPDPFWFKLIIRIVIAYAAVTALTLIFRADGGSLTHPAPGLYLSDTGHGRPIEHITQQQYDLFRRREVRLSSAILLAFYFKAAFDFLSAVFPLALYSGRGQAGASPRG